MRYQKIKKDGYTLYQNEGGKAISTAQDHIVEVDGFAFRDLEKNGTLLPYADWRLDDDFRAKDLASRLSIEEIAGLMMYSPHQMVPSLPGEPFASTYHGVSFTESRQQAFALTDQQKAFLSQDHLRHVLAMKLQDTETASRWNNELQRFVELLPHGIPVNISSDPRHGASKASAEFKSGGSSVSHWPEGLGIAATFSPKLCRDYAAIISKEYRALGIATALSPQVDLATEPRWQRFEDTFGTHPQLVADLAKAYCDGMQTTEGTSDGWGQESVATMAKHWPGGGSGEGGRDAHYPFGKYAVYPGKRFETHLIPFLQGAFALDGPTDSTAAIMPYYTISWDIDGTYGQNVGNSYSRYLITDLLRERYAYDGVVCTDWGITGDPAESIDSFGSRCFGVEELSEAKRHLLALENGVDQFGGNSKKKPILEAYELGCRTHGETAMRARMEASAVRLLKNMFRCGLFDHPYLDAVESAAIVGCPAFYAAGYQAQLDSLVLLKNNGALPRPARQKVYIPTRHIHARKGFFRHLEPAQDLDPADSSLVTQYYDRVSTPEEADFSLVFIESPLSDGYSQEDAAQGGNGYLPISLQYRPYTAVTARKPSLAGGDFRETFTDRSYQGKTGTAANEADLDLVLDTKSRMQEKPVIVCIRMHNAAVLRELEPFADAILVDFGVQQQALLDLVSGKHEPSGLLPIQLPMDMETVEQHGEDTPFDLVPYLDAAGNEYDFGFGMNWSGVLHDSRNTMYHK